MLSVVVRINRYRDEWLGDLSEICAGHRREMRQNWHARGQISQGRPNPIFTAIVFWSALSRTLPQLSDGFRSSYRTVFWSLHS